MFLSLSTAAHVQSLLHWFQLLTRWRKAAIIPLALSRKSEAHHRSQTQKENWVIDCISQVPLGIHKSQEQERQHGRISIGSQKTEPESASSSSVPIESQNPSAPASGDRLPSTLTEDDDIRNLPSLGVDLNPSLLSRVKDHQKNTFGQFDLTSFPIHTATWCVFARDFMWASFQMSRIVETYIGGCPNRSFSNTQDMLNILIGSLLEDEHNEEPVLLHGGRYSGEDLIHDERKRFL